MNCKDGVSVRAYSGEKLPRKNCKNGVRFALYSVGWLLLLSSGNSHDFLLKKWYISATLKMYIMSMREVVDFYKQQMNK